MLESGRIRSQPTLMKNLVNLLDDPDGLQLRKATATEDVRQRDRCQ